MRYLIQAGLFTGLDLLLNGFRFADGNYGDIPLVKHFNNPQYLAQDLLFRIDLQSPQFYAHRAVAALLKTLQLDGNLELGFLLLYLLGTFATYLALIHLCSFLYGSWRTTFIYCVLIVLGVRIISMGAPVLFQKSFTMKSLTDPILLWAIYLFMRRHYLPALALVGFAYNVHAARAAYLVPLFGLYHLASFRRLGVRQAVAPWAAALALASPSLVPFFTMFHTEVDQFSVDMHRYFTYGHVSPLLLFSHVPRSLLWSILGITFWAAATRLFPISREKQTILLTFYAAIAAMYVVGFFFVDIVRTPLFARLALPYSTWYFMVLALMQIAHAINVSTAALARSSSFLPGLARPLRLASQDTLLVAAAVAIVAAHGLNGMQPESESAKGWRDVQLWTNTTPPNTAFVTPPYYYNFNAYSERAQLVNYNYAGLAAFSPEVMPEYMERMLDLTGVDIRDAVRTIDFDLTDKWTQSWRDLTVQRLRWLASKYGVAYVVRETSLPLDLKKVYSNSNFSVYVID